MRTTITIEPDVAAQVRAEMKRSGEGFKEVVNRLLRRGLQGKPPARKRFVVEARDLKLRQGFETDNIGLLLEQLDAEEGR